MERDEFYFLYVNLNRLAERALSHLAAEMLREPAAPEAPVTLSAEERDAQVLAGFDNLDFSALEELDLSSINALQLGADTPPSPEQIEQRVDEHYRRADLRAMNEALAQLPVGMASLTGPLLASELTDWLALYEQGHAVLIELTRQVRQLDQA